jgi:hypothetical protein
MAVMCLYGQPGSGKTVNATRLPGKSLLISSDNSAIVLKNFERPNLTVKEAKKKAEEIVKKVKKGEDFDKLMDEYGEDGTSSQEPITISKGSMLKQFPGIKEFENFEKAAFALKVDEVSKPIKAPNGYFVLKRVVTISDATAYALETSKVSVNKSFIDDIKITVSYKKLYEESNK